MLSSGFCNDIHIFRLRFYASLAGNFDKNNFRNDLVSLLKHNFVIHALTSNTKQSKDKPNIVSSYTIVSSA